MPIGFDSVGQSKLGAFVESKLGVRGRSLAALPQTVVSLALIDEAQPEYYPLHSIYNSQLSTYIDMVGWLKREHNIVARAGVLHVAAGEGLPGDPSYQPITPFGGDATDPEYQEHIAYLKTKGITILQRGRNFSEAQLIEVLNLVRQNGPTMDPPSRMRNIMVHHDTTGSMQDIFGRIEETVAHFTDYASQQFENVVVFPTPIRVNPDNREQWLNSFVRILDVFLNWPR